MYFIGSKIIYLFLLYNIILISCEDAPVLIGSTVELECYLPLENITRATWSEEYSIYPVSKIEIGGEANNRDYLITVDAVYSEDLANSTLKIKNVKVSNGGCYIYKVFSGNRKIECKKCFTVEPHVVFRWNREGNNITRVACHVGDNNMQQYTLYWKVKGVSVGGRIALDYDDHEYTVLNDYEATEIRLLGKYDSDVKMVWCRYLTYEEIIIEYPIRFLGTSENNFHHVSNSDMRIAKDYW
ncbi:SWPV1-297 [Shearwaterpox virus]|uniref:SWPV1-297 n=1 Tax=Shearwaterpox virus TaxID=1974596 RepID=A0A1V0S898_CNPV|nr:SWPV1-297 [Shearwaterpox virus]